MVDQESDEQFICLETLRNFTLDRVLNDDPFFHTIALLGTLPSSTCLERSPAILKIDRTPLSGKAADTLTHILQSIKLVGSSDIYSWGLIWLEKHEEVPDAKINIICPATDVHIRKYSKQSVMMVQETPELYERIVMPYICAFPPARTQWVEDVLSGASEADKVLYEDKSLAHGFVLLPDMKWDLVNISALYLIAITHNRDIRSLRDLRREHLPMLRNIRRQATLAVVQHWGLEEGSLRFYIHYQPSYYHFHVHIVNTNYVGFPGMFVGQAHLLEDIISLLELVPPESNGPSILQRMTFTYGLGEQHGLFEAMKAAQA